MILKVRLSVRESLGSLFNGEVLSLVNQCFNVFLLNFFGLLDICDDMHCKSSLCGSGTNSYANRAACAIEWAGLDGILELPIFLDDLIL